MTSPAAYEPLAPFLQARAALGVALDAPQPEIKRAYRQQVALFPPDRDPEAFGRIRAAYELLSRPLEAATAALQQPSPAIPPPPLPSPAPPGELVLAALRQAIGRLPAAQILTEGAHQEPSR